MGKSGTDPPLSSCFSRVIITKVQDFDIREMLDPKVRLGADREHARADRLRRLETGLREASLGCAGLIRRRFVLNRPIAKKRNDKSRRGCAIFVLDTASLRIPSETLTTTPWRGS